MRLLIMRHAEAEQHKDNDFQKVLTENGIKQAEKVAEILCEHRIDKIVVSYAKRAMQTANIIQNSLQPTELEMVTEFYDGTEDDILDLVCYQDSEYQNLLLIGHNPTISRFVADLTEEEDEHYDDLSNNLMSPSQVVIIEFKDLDDWQDIRKHSGRIVEII